MNYKEGEDHTIEKQLATATGGIISRSYGRPGLGVCSLAWEYSDPVTLRAKALKTDPGRGTGLWAYRRIADKRLFEESAYSSDITLVNWPQNDFLDGTLYGTSPERASRNLAAAKELSLCLLYWMQKEAPRQDGGSGWKGLRLRKDVVGTEDGLAKYPYVRESRRIRAEFTVLEQHVSSEFRASELGVPASEAKATEFKDSVGISYYRIDLHPTSGGDNYLDIGALPFQIPLGALIPCRVENLLPACKNLGTTHITNGCYRLHPAEWNIGEATGLLLAFCSAKKTQPRCVRNTADLLQSFQEQLREEGISLEWPKDLKL